MGYLNKSLILFSLLVFFSSGCTAVKTDVKEETKLEKNTSVLQDLNQAVVASENEEKIYVLDTEGIQTQDETHVEIVNYKPAEKNLLLETKTALYSFYNCKKNEFITESSHCIEEDFTQVGIDDYVSLDNEILNGIGNFTISTWFKTYKLGEQSLLSGANETMFDEILLFLNNNKELVIYLHGNRCYFPIPDIADDNWHFLTWSREGSTNKIYLNGIESGTCNLPFKTLKIEPNGLIVGQEQDILGSGFDESQSFDGIIDKMMFTQKSLSPETILELKNATHPKNLQVTKNATIVNDDSLSIGVGESKLIKMLNKGKVIVGNPNILKVTTTYSAGENYLVLSGKSEGYSSILLLLNNGDKKAWKINVYKQNYNLEAINNDLHRLFPNSAVSMLLDESNTLVLKGSVRDKYDMDAILQYAQNLGGNVTNLVKFQQISRIKLEAKIIEISRTKMKAAGMNLLSIGSSGSLGVASAGTLSSYNVAQGAAGASMAPAFHEAFQIMFGIGDVSGILSLLESKGMSKTLSTPSTIAEDGKEAKLFVGGEIPVPIPQGTGDAITVTWKEYGIKLNFLPKINEDGKISLKLMAQVGDTNPNNGVVISGLSIPSIDTRNVESEVTLEDKEDFLIGGLLFSKQKNIEDKVPVLGDIPFIGTFFKKMKSDYEELELIISIRPTIVTENASEELLGKEDNYDYNWDQYLLGSFYKKSHK